MHIITDLDLGGTETALYNLLRVMGNDQYELLVVVLVNPGYYSAKITALEIPVYYMNMKTTSIIKAFFRLCSLIKATRPDIVQTWLYHADFFGGLSAKLCGVKKIIWGIRSEGRGLKRTTTWIKRGCALLSWAIPDTIITNSKAAADCHRQTGYYHKKITVIPNGFDNLRFSPEKDKTPLNNLTNQTLPKDAFIIGTLARFHPDKDYLTLTKAVDEVCRRHENVYFVFCGPGCHQSNGELNAMINSLTFHEHIRLINGTNNAPLYLNTLDVFVLTSKTESFPNSLAEAMLCGVPCIASEVGDVREMVGNTGLLIPPESPEELTNACLAMMQKTVEERHVLAASARQRIQQDYSIASNNQCLKALYAQ